MLKIVKAQEPIEIKQIVAMIYAPPGTGKTSLAFTADKPLLLDFDGGAHRSGNRGDCVRIQSWKEMQEMKAEDVAGYKTIVIDTVGRALDCLAIDVINCEPKHGQRDGSLSLKGFGALKARFTAWVKYMKALGMDIVLVAHSTERPKGDDVEERIVAQGGSKDEIYMLADIMGRLAIRNGKRVLLFSPTDAAYGKNPAGFAPLDVPDFAADKDFMARVIKDTKAVFNEMGEESIKVQAMIDAWIVRIGDCLGADEFNALMPATQEADPQIRDNVKRIMVKAAGERGIVYDKKDKKFVAEGE